MQYRISTQNSWLSQILLKPISLKLIPQFYKCFEILHRACHNHCHAMCKISRQLGKWNCCYGREGVMRFEFKMNSMGYTFLQQSPETTNLTYFFFIKDEKRNTGHNSGNKILKTLTLMAVHYIILHFNLLKSILHIYKQLIGSSEMWL